MKEDVVVLLFVLNLALSPFGEFIPIHREGAGGGLLAP